MLFNMKIAGSLDFSVKIGILIYFLKFQSGTLKTNSTMIYDNYDPLIIT